MNENVRKKLYNKADLLVGHFAMLDYKKVNYKNGKMKYKKNHPYSLGYETIEAREILSLLYKKASDISLDDEILIKGYLISKYRRDILNTISSNVK